MSEFVYEDRGYVTPCRVWQGGCTKGGYGVRRRGRRFVYVHREEFERAYGPLADGVNVLHRCDQPPCAEPSHLFAGSQLENLRDARSKGRLRPPPHTPGERQGGSKLTAVQVAEIRAARGRVTQRELAARYGVSCSTISHVQTGRNWRIE